MVTTVGRESTPQELVCNLILLERDAIAAYDTVRERLSDESYRAQITEFRGDHEAHLADLRRLAVDYGIEPPTEGDAKEMLTTGKVKLADMMGGDGAILKAMSSNETDTVTAYENGTENPDLPPEMRPVVERALADERRHKAWMEQAAAAA